LHRWLYKQICICLSLWDSCIGTSFSGLGSPKPYYPVQGLSFLNLCPNFRNLLTTAMKMSTILMTTLSSTITPAMTMVLIFFKFQLKRKVKFQDGYTSHTRKIAS
jgi:hypothetical protein